MQLSQINDSFSQILDHLGNRYMCNDTEYRLTLTLGGKGFENYFFEDYM